MLNAVLIFLVKNFCSKLKNESLKVHKKNHFFSYEHFRHKVSLDTFDAVLVTLLMTVPSKSEKVLSKSRKTFVGNPKKCDSS